MLLWLTKPASKACSTGLSSVAGGLHQIDRGLCAYLISDKFQSSIQFALGLLLVSLFIFIRPLAYSNGGLSSLFVPMGFVLCSANLHAGGRAEAAAMLGAVSQGIVAGATLVTIARQTGAVTVWLVVLAAAFLILVTIVRCMHMLTGLLLGITVSMGLLIAERTETHLIWPQVVWGLLRDVWLSAGATLFVGFFIFATSCREAIGHKVAGHMQQAGQALSSVTSHFRPDLNDASGNFRLYRPDEVPIQLPRPLKDELTPAEEHQRAVDPNADHALRHLKDPTVRTVAGLRSGLLQTRGLLATAAYEPNFYGSCRLQLSALSAILASVEALATRIATLESLLEGDELVMDKATLQTAFGKDPMPHLQQVLATVAASIAAMAQVVSAVTKGNRVSRSRVATEARDRQYNQLREMLSEGHEFWRQGVAAEHGVLYISTERRAILIIVVQSLGLLDAMYHLEEQVGAAIESQVTYSFPWKWRPVSGTEIVQRAMLELQPMLTFLRLFVGFPHLKMLFSFFTVILPGCFVSWQHAFTILWWNRHFHFGVKFWLSLSGALALILPLSSHFAVVANQRRFYLMIALTATLQERADATITRSILRAAFAGISGTLGFLVMLRPVTASSPYALAAISTVWAFIVGTYGNSPLKYAVYLADLIYNGIVFNQYDDAPDHHGKATVYADRMAEYAIGIAIALIATLPHPWYLAGDSLEHLGVALVNAGILAKKTVLAYIEELQLQDFDGHKHRPGELAGQSRQLRKSISVKIRELTTLSLALPPQTIEIGIARLHEANIISKVSTVIGSTSIQIGKEKVLWSKGLLTLPSIVPKLMAEARVVEERLTLLHIVATHEAFISGRRSRAMYAGIIKPLHGDLTVLMDLAVNLTSAIYATLEERSGSSSHNHLEKAVSALSTQRVRVQQCLQDKQAALRQQRKDFPEGKSILDIATQDDVFRCYGTLLVLITFLDKIMLFANIVAQDRWLKHRASKPWYSRSLAYIW
ncbi:hypothetical protein WJX74_002507 [Apatococcus lobatus]|uniref:Uncharacterized protein n=1 Tax=Apatococcus lobatus TaxID=904363 RepID=A0AAW1QBX9_9CHLO